VCGVARSWDLFGTLAAGRDPFKRDGDQDQHIPIAENIRNVLPGDIVISDFYDAPKAERILREVCGLHNELHVSHDDKATGKIWQQLERQARVPRMHTGDDEITDYHSPRSHGIPATLTMLAKRTEWEQRIHELGLPQLSAIVREARLRTFNPEPTMRRLELFQIEANFPFLYVASLWFNHKLRAGGYTKFLMSARDCFLWKKIMERLAGDAYEPFYWLTSRYTRYKPSKSYLDYCEPLMGPKTLITDFCGFGRSLMHFLIANKTHARVCLLIGYGHEDYPCFVEHAVPGWTDEAANFARHPMVLDVVGSRPVFWQDGIDWQAVPEINTMHAAFDVCCAAMDQHVIASPDFATLTDLLPKMLEYMGTRLKALEVLTPFRRDEAIRAAELMKDIEGVIA